MKISFKLSLAFFLVILFFHFPLHSQESMAHSQPAESLPSDSSKTLSLSEKSKSRLDEIADDLQPLQKRIAEGDKSLQQEAANVPAFLEIQDIALEEFRPYLKRWELMLDSYRYVLDDIDAQIDEVAKIRTRLHSKLQLWKLKESDAKLAAAQIPRSQHTPALQAELNELSTTITALEAESDHADEVMGDLGKVKTSLSQALEVCVKNYNLLQKRWEDVRFSRLKWVNQPNFSTESINLAWQEMQFRARNFNINIAYLKDYLDTVGRVMQQETPRTFFYFLIWLALGFALWKARKRHKTIDPKNTSLDKFTYRAAAYFFMSLPALMLLLAEAILLAGFSEIRLEKGYWIIALSSGLWASWFLFQCSKILFVDTKDYAKLISIPSRTARSIHRHFCLLIILVFFFSLLNFSAYILEYDSVASRTLEWFFEISIFLVLLSLIRPSWISILVERSSYASFFRPFKHGLRALLFIILISVLILDTMGYTYLSDYIADATLKSMGVILLMILVKNSLREWLDHILYDKLLKKPNLHFSIVRQWVNTLQLWTQITLWILFIYTLASIWDIVPELNHFMYVLWNWGFVVGPIKITVGLLFSVLLIFYISSLLSHLIQFLLERNLYPRKDWDPGIRQAFSTGVRYISALIALLISLRLLGFGLQNVTVLAGALGVGLGFGLQNIANNFASGIILLIERPIKVDDMIQVNNIIGRVKSIGARSTVIETGEKASILIPNGELLAGQLINWTYGNSVAGINIPVGVAYGSDIQKVKTLLLQIASENTNLLKSPEPQLEFKDFGDSSLNLVLHVWIPDVSLKGSVQTDLMIQITQKFQQNGIDIPFPQRVVHMKKEE